MAVGDNGNKSGSWNLVDYLGMTFIGFSFVGEGVFS